MCSGQGYFGGAAFSLFGPVPMFSFGGLTYAIYAVCIYFSNVHAFLAPVGGAFLGVGAGLFWAAQGALMMGYATPQSRGRLIALFWVIFNLGGVFGGLLQFGLNFENHTGRASPLSYFSFVVVMLAGALAAPLLLSDPKEVVREDGTPVQYEEPQALWEEITAAVNAVSDPFVRQCLLFFLASNWFYTYDFSGFNGTQFNMRTRGLNSTAFWLSQMAAAWLFGGVLDGQSPVARRAWTGMVVVVNLMAASLGLALWINVRSDCGGGGGWDKGRPCELDFLEDFPQVALPMGVFALLGAADAVYQNYAYWLMSTAAGDSASKTVSYSAVYKGAQSLGAGCAWLLDIPSSVTYRSQCVVALVLTLGAFAPVVPALRHLGDCKKEAAPGALKEGAVAVEMMGRGRGASTTRRGQGADGCPVEV